jgi:putative membrane protein
VKAVQHLILAAMVAGLLSLPMWAQTSDKTGKSDPSATQTSKAQNDKASTKQHEGDRDRDQQKAGAQGSLSQSDKMFIEKAAQDGKAEVELGQLAQEKASSDDVKNFAKQLVNDHQQANDQLQKIAQEKGISIPDKPDAKEQGEKDRLSKLNGADFDKAFMREAVKDHRQDIRQFRKEANSGKDQDVKSFASNTLPKLEEHLKMAQSMTGAQGKNHEHKAGGAQAKY